MDALNTPARAPWELERGRLWSLWEMFRYPIERMIGATINYTIFNVCTEHTPSEFLDENEVQALNDAMDEIGVLCHELRLPTTWDRLGLARERLAVTPITPARAIYEVRALADSVFSECKSAVFLFIEPESRDCMLLPVARFFGPEVTERFSVLEYDLEESMRCRALGRHTASVFHATRAMEAVSRAVWVSLKKPQRNAKKTMNGMGDYLAECESYIAAAVKDSSAAPTGWSISKDFYTGILADIRAAYKAWRCPTMHMEQEYQSDRAGDILNAVRALISHAATKIDQSGAWV